MLGSAMNERSGYSRGIEVLMHKLQIRLKALVKL